MQNVDRRPGRGESGRARSVRVRRGAGGGERGGDGGVQKGCAGLRAVAPQAGWRERPRRRSGARNVEAAAGLTGGEPATTRVSSPLETGATWHRKGAAPWLSSIPNGCDRSTGGGFFGGVAVGAALPLIGGRPTLAAGGGGRRRGRRRRRCAAEPIDMARARRHPQAGRGDEDRSRCAQGRPPILRRLPDRRRGQAAGARRRIPMGGAPDRRPAVQVKLIENLICSR